MASAFTCLVAVSTPAPAGLMPLARRHAGTPIRGTETAPDIFGFAAIPAALGFARDAATPPHRIGMHALTAPDVPALETLALVSGLARAAQPGVILSTWHKNEVPGAEAALPAVRIVAQTPIELPGRGAPVEVVRIEPRAAETLRFGCFELDLDRFELRRDGARIPVEPRTFDLIALLARHAGRTLPRETIFQNLWGDRIVSEAALSSQVRAARKALGDDGTRQNLIATVHGRGFRLRARALEPAGRDPETGPPAAPPPPAAARLAAPRATTARPVIAVLPCTAIGTDLHTGLLAAGLTEDMINALTRHRWLRVITRNPAVALARAQGWGQVTGAADADLPPGPLRAASGIAAHLGAGYALTSSLRRLGSRLCVSVQLSDACTMQCLWSERFEREMRDIFALQAEIAELVAARIAAELGRAEGARAARTARADHGAWELYALGSAEFYRFTSQSNRRCQELMRAALALDPDFSDAHARLAYAMTLEMVYFEGPIDNARLDEALRCAEAAVALDEQDANAHFTLGRVRLVRCEYVSAIESLHAAIALNPCHALSHCGLGDSLAYEGRIPEAIAAFDRAIELSPQDPFRWAFMSYRSLAHLFDGAYDSAAHWARRATQVPNAHYWARSNLAAAHGLRGATSQARQAAQALTRARPGFCRGFARERMFFVRSRDHVATFIEGLRRAGVP